MNSIHVTLGYIFVVVAMAYHAIKRLSIIMFLYSVAKAQLDLYF